MPSLSLYTTTLAWVDYNLFTRTLRVKFRQGGRVAEFQTVPAPVYRELVASPSPDEFFRNEIENQFPVTMSTLMQSRVSESIPHNLGWLKLAAIYWEAAGETDATVALPFQYRGHDGPRQNF